MKRNTQNRLKLQPFKLASMNQKKKHFVEYIRSAHDFSARSDCNPEKVVKLSVMYVQSLWVDMLRKSCSLMPLVTPTQQMVTYWSFSNSASLDIELCPSVIKMTILAASVRAPWLDVNEYCRAQFSALPIDVNPEEYVMDKTADWILLKVEYLSKLKTSVEDESNFTTLNWFAVGPIKKCATKS